MISTERFVPEIECDGVPRDLRPRGSASRGDALRGSTFRDWVIALLLLVLVGPAIDGASLQGQGVAPIPADDVSQFPVLKKQYLGLTWHDFDRGLARAKEERQVVLLVVEDAEQTIWPQLEGVVTGKRLLKLLDKVVRIAVPSAQGEAPDPKQDPALPKGSGGFTVRRLLGNLEGKGAIVLLDSERTLLKRWDKTPSKSNFRKILVKALQLNAALVEKSERISKLLAKSSYALELKKFRESVQLYLQAEKVGFRSGSAAAEKATALRKKLDDLMAKGEKEAKAFVDKKALGKAVDRYERLVRNFPFPDRQRSWRKEITELWRLIRSPYGR